MVNPWKTYWKLSAVLMGSHGLTKGSLAFLNYPAQIMFKSTKVNSVLINLFFKLIFMSSNLMSRSLKVLFFFLKDLCTYGSNI
jgi:hypothetical protein